MSTASPAHTVESDALNAFVTPIQTFARSGVIRVAIKDLFDASGQPTRAGSESLSDVKPAARDAQAIEMLLRDSRLRIVGKTGLDEFALTPTGMNVWTGDVLNPLDGDRVSGGSSSGSAVAVAAGYADIGLGTDTGGSIRIPSAFCGVMGIKPTSGVISTRGVYPLSQELDTVGPIARDATTLRLAMSLLAPGLVSGPPSGSAAFERIVRLRFRQAETLVDAVVDAALEATGAQVVDTELDDWEDANFFAYQIVAFQAWANNRSLAEEHPHLIGPQTSQALTYGAGVSVSEFANALRFRADWARRVSNLFQIGSRLVCPTVADIAPLRSDVDALDWAAYCRTLPFNLSGHPAVSIPLPGDAGAMPCGLQAIGPYGTDMSLLDYAARIEAMVAPTPH